MRAPYRTLRNLSKQFVGKGMALQRMNVDMAFSFVLGHWKVGALVQDARDEPQANRCRNGCGQQAGFPNDCA